MACPNSLENFGIKIFNKVDISSGEGGNNEKHCSKDAIREQMTCKIASKLHYHSGLTC